MVEFRKGISQKPASTASLISFFEERSQLNGVLYIGYPILYAAGESTTIDALWLSPEYGVIIFDMIEGQALSDRSDVHEEIYSKISSLLIQHKQLVEKRLLSVAVEIYTWAPACKKEDYEFKCVFGESDLSDKIDTELNSWEKPELFTYTLAVIQSVIRLKSQNKRPNVKKEASRGAKIKALETTISHLDQEQEKAVIESFEGVQRIRGLAGSGKTIVLALKVAYLHAQNPSWKIAVTFNTRSLKNQFKELIERFCIEKKGEMPDWSNVRILQAWGSPNTPGLYFEACRDYGVEYYDFRKGELYWRQQNLTDQPLLGSLCSKALGEIKVFKQVYDAILVDEAQDLSESFLQICYHQLKNPKRLIYAYDELQKLNEGTSLRSPKNIFGISNYQDTLLHKCYRNSRPLLVTAHGLGFGIYRGRARPEDFVQFFDKPQLWSDVGYTVEQGRLEAGENVVLARTEESSPEYLEKHSELDDLLLFKSFSSPDEQAIWIAEQITKNILQDELLYKDVIVINANSLTTKKEIIRIREHLFESKIPCHVAGDLNADIFFEENSIAFTGINRAKGNEVPMVYIVNAQDCFDGQELRKRRNILFTAITRSKAWVRICGVGPSMNNLIQEFTKIRDTGFKLKFNYPTKVQIDKMNLIHRDVSEDEKIALNNEANLFRDIGKIILKIKAGKAAIEDYPEDVQVIIRQLTDEASDT
jgi:superfamily I DNA and RNA helicase